MNTINDFLEDAISKITIDVVKSLSYGEELELNEEYTLYHYTEDDIIVLNKTEEWEEIYQTLYNEEDGKIILEKL
jgi:hypothetical protein